MLYQVLYSSKSATALDAAALEKILNDARSGNEARDITGALIYVDQVFFQVLEGPREAIDELLHYIERDTRHHSMKVFYRSQISARTFPDWQMAYLSSNAEEMSDWAGLPGAGNIGELLREVQRDQDRVPKILLSIMQALATRAGGVE